jgi:hypothetical protein
MIQNLLKDFKMKIEEKINQDFKGNICNNYILFINENKKNKKFITNFL